MRQIPYTQNENDVSKSFLLRLFVPFAFAFLIASLLRMINNVLAPTFIQTFDMGASDLGIMTSAFFLSFALAQIPLGVCLDRYGSGRTLTGFMIFGVLGCFVFASAQSIIFLFVGRALVGLGVSGCLMAAYKAFGDWLPREKLPIYNSLQSFVGGVGGMVATTPINAALGFVSWRVVFIVLGLLTLVSALLVYGTPNRVDASKNKESLTQYFKGTLDIALSKHFWRLAPLGVMGQASYLALNSLWIGPWFRDVAGFPKDAIPDMLFVCALSLSIGSLCNGFIATGLKARYGIKVIRLVVIAMSIFTGVMGLIILLPQYGTFLWPLFNFVGPFSLLTYPIFSSMFNQKLSGRVLTTYNMLVFLASFVIQSTIGVVIDMYKPLLDGSFNPAGYTIAFAGVFLLLCLSILWCIFYRRGKSKILY